MPVILLTFSHHPLKSLVVQRFFVFDSIHLVHSNESVDFVLTDHVLCLTVSMGGLVPDVTKVFDQGGMKGGSLDDNLTEIRGKLSLIIALRFEFNIVTYHRDYRG